LPACSAASSVNSGVCARKYLYISHENREKSPSSPCVYPPQLQQQTLSPTRHNSSGLVTGSDFSITWCTSVKIAVVAPIPSPSVMSAVVVTPGAFRNCRTASRKSGSKCPPQRCNTAISPQGYTDGKRPRRSLAKMGGTPLRPRYNLTNEVNSDPRRSSSSPLVKW